MPIAKLSIDLEAKLANLQSGLDKAAAASERTASRIEKSFAGLSSLASGVGAGLVAGLSVGRLVSYFKSAADGLDKLNDLKDATGATIENLSALEDVAIRTGTGVDSAADAVIKLNKALNTASDPNSDAAGAIKAIGLNVEDLKRLDPVQALLQVGLALNSFADNGAKGRIELTLLGKSTKELAPLLKDLAESGTLNATVTTKQAEEAERFNKHLFAMQKNSIDTARSISGPLISALNELFDKMVPKGRRFTWAEILGLPEDAAADKAGVSQYADRIAALQKLLEAGNLTQERRVRLETQLAGLRAKEATDAQRRVEDRGFSPAPGDNRPSLRDPKVKDPKEKTPRVKTERPGIGGPPLDRQEAFRLSELADQAKTNEILRTVELTEAEKERADAIKFVADQQQKLDAILAQTPSAQLDAVYADIALINKAFNAGTIDAEKWGEAMRVATGKLDKGGKEALDEWTAFADQAARNIQDSLGNTIEATLSGNFKNIANDWKRTIDRMVAQSLAANLAKTLLGDFGKTGDLGGLAGEAAKYLSTFFPSAKGNAFYGGAPMAAFASGGIFGRGGGVLTGPTVFPMARGMGLAGEAGPEAVMPLKRGRNGKLGVQAAGGGGVTIHNNITWQGGAPDRQSLLQLQAAVGQATQRAIARNT